MSEKISSRNSSEIAIRNEISGLVHVLIVDLNPIAGACVTAAHDSYHIKVRVYTGVHH